MIKWPTRAKAAIRSLFLPLQDVEVYVEDENDEVFYRTLLKRVAEPEIKVARVISLGNRTAVIKAANAYDYSTRPAVFIIDGDLEWVRGLPAPAGGKGLHRHNAYCVENLLMCGAAITSLLAQDAVLTDEAAIKAVKFSEWVKDIEGPLIDLFAAYAVAQTFAPHLKTVSTGVGVMCTNSRKGKASSLDPVKVTSNTANILIEIDKVEGKTKARSEFASIKARIQSLGFPLDAVSGKDFLMPLLNMHLQSLGSNINRRSLRVRLASMCQDSKLSDLRSAVRLASKK